MLFVIEPHSFISTGILQIFAFQQAVDTYVNVFAKTQDDLAQRTFVIETRLLIGTPTADIIFHSLGLDAIEVQFHKTIAYHQFRGFGSIAFAPGGAIADNYIESRALVDVIDIFEPDQADQAIVLVESNTKNNVFPIWAGSNGRR